MEIQFASFYLLPYKDWAKDFSFRRYMNEYYHVMGDYYCDEKDNLTLFELLNYLDEDGLRHTINYYGFPADMQQFVGWVWNNVGTSVDMEIPDNLLQHQFFPFRELYQIYLHFHLRDARVVVHEKKITDYTGVLLYDLVQQQSTHQLS